MKVIFLDVDGVLNHRFSKARCGGVIGIEKQKVELLSKIIKATDAKVVLTSTWRTGLDDSLKPCDKCGKYLLKRLMKYGGISIFGKTEYLNVWNRGEEIIEWLKKHGDVESWIVLDDEIFKDYRRTEVIDRLVKTDWYKNGLEKEHVEQAIKLLNEKEVV